jgi:DNA-binding NtrC family response regulator
MSSLLFIESEPLHLLDQMSQLLGPKGINIAVAHTGGMALRMAENDPPDVVVCDVSMPDMSGLEIYKRLKQIDPRLPVIFITATATAEAALEAVRQGAYDYLFKPVDLSHLEKVVAEALELSRNMRQSPVLARLDGRQSFKFENYISDLLSAGTSDLYSEAHLQLDRILLPATLRWVNGNQLHAARILGIARQTLRNRLRELGLSITKSIDGDGAVHKQLNGDGAMRGMQDGRDGQGDDRGGHGDGRGMTNGSEDHRSGMRSYR